MTPVFLPYVSAKKKRKLMPSPRNGQVYLVIKLQGKKQKRLHAYC
nr:MAG TPA: hypothetical protein [Caudoviricetes sp.]